jgi:MbtH protein
MAQRDEEEDTRAYLAVVNDEEQYSIWLADKDIPAGWRAVGKSGSKAECLAYIGEVWTDMRPLSLRKWMAEQEAKPGGGAGPAGSQGSS